MATSTRAIKSSQRRNAKRRLIKRDGAVCAACGATEALTIDHIVPVAHGGGHRLENLQLLCLACNQAKGLNAA